MTSGEFTEKTVTILNEASIEDARFICILLLEKVTSGQYDPSYELSADQISELEELLIRVLKNEPVAYIVGKRDFYHDSFKVTPAVLIPRSDSEIIIETALAFLGLNDFMTGDLLNVPKTEISGPVRFADICTGSGCLGIALANDLFRKKRSVSGVLTDISGDALEVAGFNIENSALDKDSLSVLKYDVLKEDLLEGKFDLIISNPPYVKTSEMLELPDDVRFEPSGALEAGSDGMRFYPVIAKAAMEHLSENGMLIFEHGFEQGEPVRNVLTALGFKDVMTIKDYGGNDRVTIGRIS